MTFSPLGVHEPTFAFSVGMKPSVYTQSVNLLLEKRITSVYEGEGFIQEVYTIFIDNKSLP